MRARDPERPAPRPFPYRAVARKYALVRWTEMPRGGHFPALEAPEDLAAEIRAFFAGLA